MKPENIVRFVPETVPIAIAAGAIITNAFLLLDPQFRTAIRSPGSKAGSSVAPSGTGT